MPQERYSFFRGACDETDGADKKPVERSRNCVDCMTCTSYARHCKGVRNVRILDLAG